MLEEVPVSPERKRQVQLLLLHSEHGAAEATRGVPGEGRARPRTTPQGMQGAGTPPLPAAQESRAARPAQPQAARCQPGTGGAASSVLTSWTLLQGFI